MGISGVGSFTVWSAGSLIIFQLFRCRNLALIGFPTFLSGRHVLYLEGVWMPLHVYTPHMFIHPWGFRHPHMSPILCASVCSQRLLHVVGGCRGPLTCWTPLLHAGHLPHKGVPPHVLHTPLIGWLPCASVYFGDICMSYGEYSPYVGGLGVSAPWGVHMLHLVPSCSSLCLIYLPQL